MIRISNYSLNYSRQIRERKMNIAVFLSLCRQLGCDGASLHIRNLSSTQTGSLKDVRRAYLDNGLSMSMFSVSTNFGQPEAKHAAEFQKVNEAIRVGLFLGAPLLRVFAGSPPQERDRQQAFARAAAALRKVCEMGAEAGLPIGLQNHNHGALCRTGDDVLQFIKLVEHPNFVFILDAGQFAGSHGASGKAPPELRDADYLESIQKTASVARHVRTKFYHPRKDGSEPFIDYAKVFNVLRSVHYNGFVDIVYEPNAGGGDAVETAVPRIVNFLRSQISE